MSTIIVKCTICNQTLITAEGTSLGESDVNMYNNSCQCSVDGPFQTYDDNGNPLPMDYSNIVATLTE